MVVNRRSALKHFLIISGGVLVLPSCLHHKEKASINLKNLSINADDEKLLAEISETMIPATNTPGAKDLYTHLYTMKMVDDCYDKEKQQQFENGLKELDDLAVKRYGNHFIKCSLNEKENLLNDIEGKKLSSQNLSGFYSIMKRTTITGYMTSKYVMTNLVVYKLVPGRFHGTFPINNKNNKA